MANYTLDAIFHALSDSTRREVLVQLCKGPKSVSELAKPFDMALPSFTQHLSVLEGSGLIESKKDGRVRFIYLVPNRIEKVEGWLEKQRNMWEKRFDSMDDYLLKLKEK
ncbi:MAG: ArsR/SmtB family transcription factor [bacterium]